jgi:hypothetical protein
MPQWLFPVICCFCVSEKLYRKYSRNWTKQKQNLLLFTKASRSPKRRRRGATGWPHHRAARLARGPRPLWVRPPWSTSNAAPSPIKTPRCEKPKPDQFSRNTSRSGAVVDPRSGGSRRSSRHPAREGNRHRRSSSSPCLPPVRWVSSLPWTMGP